MGPAWDPGRGPLAMVSAQHVTGMRIVGPLGATVLAVCAVLLLVAVDVRQAPASSALEALRLPALPEAAVPDPAYQAGFPHSYFSSAPNPMAQYAWVCPGPSRLDDSHSGACPESATGGFRCCIDSATGGAVADNMCCPRLEKQAATSVRAPSTRALQAKLESTLGRMVLNLEKAEQPKPPQLKASYMSKTEARADLNSYFAQLPGSPAPKRWLASEDARKDLHSFFRELSKGTLAGLAYKRKPWKAPPLPDASKEVDEVSGELARKVHEDIKVRGSASAKEKFEEWRRRSIGRRRMRPSVLTRAALSQTAQQHQARQSGKATFDAWNGRRVHYYTATLGRDGAEDDEGSVFDLGDGLIGVRADTVISSTSGPAQGVHR